jgi:DNA-binding transcriptional LysR family regulator
MPIVEDTLLRKLERLMPDLADLEAFVQTASLGGFTRAAARLGISKSMVTRRIARLEAELGVRLLTRTTRGVSLTEAGIELERRARHILSEVEEAREAVSGRVGDIAGTLRLTAPLSFGIAHLAPALAEFAQTHPRLRLDLHFSDRFSDLVSDGFDAAVRIGMLRDSTLVARHIAPVRMLPVASPTYLVRKGEPKSPADLVNHDALIYSGAIDGEIWRFRSGRRWLSLRVQGRMRADNGEALREAAIAGLGIVALPTFLLSDAIERGALTPILVAYPMPEHGLYVVRPPGEPPGKIRALTDFLSSRFGPEPYWDPCCRALHKAE